MDDSSSSSSGGIGALGLLGVVFVLAKVFGVEPVAAWSWVWVLCPFWAGLAIVAAIVLGGAVIFIAAHAAVWGLEALETRKRRRNAAARRTQR